ncbi:MAG TPA: hypothetical protein VFV99_31310 [Kofleriaceae bacterium]|nr:hypothetical protein [Kofleriaceae bacterium]
MASAAEILGVLDAESQSFSFPMLDNGYVYPAAARLSLYRSDLDWAVVIEIFGYSPRAGVPTLDIGTFGSRLANRKPASNYVTEEAHRNYLRAHPHDEHCFLYPIDDGPWIDEELVTDDPDGELTLRGQARRLPSRAALQGVGIELADPNRIHIFELCRYLAVEYRDGVLATPSERCVNVVPGTQLILQLEDWHHPDLVKSQWPSHVESFRQLAEVLATGDTSRYQPSLPPNTHWKHWPDGGTL